MTRQNRRTSPSSIGQRIRQLRIARGVTQKTLGGDRYSKEYISEFERGLRRPTTAALDWLADRLGVSRRFLETGFPSSGASGAVGLISRSGDVIRPFRWDVSRREQLGSLPEIERPRTPHDFERDLLTCCARVIAFAGDSDLAFVGRSPEYLFDLVSGLLLETSWRDRLSLLNVSLRDEDLTDVATRAIAAYFDELRLSPRKLVLRPRPVAFVDVVDTGGTFGSLLTLLNRWSEHEGVEWRSAARKIRLVGLTWRTHTSPKTWRWQQHSDWVELLRPRSIRNVSLPPDLATYLAADVPKVTESFPPWRWSDPSVTRPPRDDEARAGLALALHLFELGQARETRRQFARELAKQPAVAYSWFRSLALEVKR